jgi:hypothetical protein
MSLVKPLIIAFLLFFTLTLTKAQQKKYPEHFGDIFKSDKALLGKTIIKGDVGFATSKISFLDANGDLIEFMRWTSKVNVHINPFKNFYVKNTFYFDLINNADAPLWLSNHFYQIGIYNWRRKTFSYGFENYQPNRFRNAEFDYWTNMKRGFFFVSYNIEFNKEINPKNPFFIDNTSKVLIVPLFRAQPEYTDINNQALGFFKPIIGTNIRYVILKNIYVETGVFYYPIQITKLPWDPDYTYGFGISNWKAFKVNISYGNWIANRYPWLDKEMKHGFLNGEFTLNLTYAW